MGFYINPKEETKEEWLTANADAKSRAPEEILMAKRQEQVPVVLMDNGMFTAAGVAHCREEFSVFADDLDPRPKVYYLVKKEKVNEVMGLEIEYLW